MKGAFKMKKISKALLKKVVMNGNKLKRNTAFIAVEFKHYGKTYSLKVLTATHDNDIVAYDLYAHNNRIARFNRTFEQIW